jgi:23S rRNA-/tRNA-specific pseudouridylate synthase
MLVSHRTGKKAETDFRRLQTRGRYSLWEATTSYARLHQIPIHATEVGLNIVGDRRYAREPEIYLSQLKRSFRLKRAETERSLYTGPAMFLAQIKFPLPDGGEQIVQCPAPKRFDALLKSLARYGR